MPLEIPELGKFVIQSFESENLAFPVVVVSRDPTIGGYVLPSIGTACPDPRYTATHAFTGLSVTNLDNRVLWKYERLPGPILETDVRSEAVRARTVKITEQTGATGGLAIETGDLIISSQVQEIDANRDKRTTKKVASLPPDEVNAYWEFVPLPLLIFDIVNSVFCNNSEFASLVTKPVKSGGSSVLRKHRKTVSYSLTPPDLLPDLSASSFAIAAIDYQGKFIRFNYGNVLNDAISFTADLYTSSAGSACFWTEAYSFGPTTPSATIFAAGDWYAREFSVEPWGDSGWKTTKIEFYSAEGNPPL